MKLGVPGRGYIYIAGHREEMVYTSLGDRHGGYNMRTCKQGVSDPLVKRSCRAHSHPVGMLFIYLSINLIEVSHTFRSAITDNV